MPCFLGFFFYSDVYRIRYDLIQLHFKSADNFAREVMTDSLATAIREVQERACCAENELAIDKARHRQSNVDTPRRFGLNLQLSMKHSLLMKVETRPLKAENREHIQKRILQKETNLSELDNDSLSSNK